VQRPEARDLINSVFESGTLTALWHSVLWELGSPPGGPPNERSDIRRERPMSEGHGSALSSVVGGLRLAAASATNYRSNYRTLRGTQGGRAAVAAPRCMNAATSRGSAGVPQSWLHRRALWSRLRWCSATGISRKTAVAAPRSVRFRADRPFIELRDTEGRVFSIGSGGRRIAVPGHEVIWAHSDRTCVMRCAV
jgi:hypothetical protein